jgi:parallel beta-helix repeat protein
LIDFFGNNIRNNFCSFNTGDGIDISGTAEAHTKYNGIEHTVFEATSGNYATDVSTADNNGRKLATDGNNLYAVYSRRKSTYHYDQIYCARSADNGVTWKETRISTGLTYMADYQLHPSIAVDGNGTIYVVWDGDIRSHFSYNQISFAKSTDGGVTFSTPTRITKYVQYDSNYCPAIVVDGNNKLHVVWYGQTPKSSSKDNIQYSCSTDGGTTWAAVTEITSSSKYTSIMPSIAIDNNNSIHVAWGGRSDEIPNAANIYYRKFTTSWGETETVTNETFSNYRNRDPCITTDNNNKPHIVWERFTPATDPRYHVYYTDKTGTNWSKPRRLSVSTLDTTAPSISISKDGVRHVVWHGFYGKVIYSNRSSGDSNWSYPSQITRHRAHHRYPSLLDARPLIVISKGFAVVYSKPETTNYDIKYWGSINLKIPGEEKLNNILFNNICTNNEFGISIKNSNSNDIFNNYCGNNVYGLFISNSNSNLIVGDTFHNNGQTGLVLNNSDNDIIRNCSLSGSSNIGVDITNGSNEIMINNCTIENSLSLHISMDNDSHSTLLNTTFDAQKVQYLDTLSNLTVQWFMHIRVINAIAAPVPNAEYNITDNLSKSLYYGISDMSGWQKWLLVNEYIENKSGKIRNFTPHNVSADHIQYEKGYAVPEPYMNKSRIVTIILPYDITSPDQPTNFMFTSVGRTYLEFAWSASTSIDVQGYNISINDTGSSTSFHYLTTTTNLSFNATGLAEDTVYHFRVVAIDHVFHESTPIGGFNKTLDFTPPEPPINLEISAVWGNYINLTWQSSISLDVEGYQVYVNDTGSTTSFHLLDTTSNPHYSHTNLYEETTYHYKILAFDEVPLYSLFSNIKFATTLDITPPTPPKDLTAYDPTGYDIKLKWDPNSEIDLEGYYIFMNNTDAGKYGPYLRISVVPSSTTQYKVTGLIEETTYYFVITAFDEVPNNSTFSNIANSTTLDVTPPAAPTGLTVASKTNDSITLKWNSNTETDLNGYSLFRSTTNNPSNWGESIETIPKGTEEYIDTGLDEEITYYYVIKAFDEVPNYSLFSNIASDTTPDGTRPKPPTGLRISERSINSLTLSWEPNHEEDLVGYYIFNSQSSTISFTKINQKPISETTYIDSGLKEATRYYYKLQAVDDFDLKSDFSETVPGKTLLGPYPPEINNSVDNVIIYEDSYNDKSINLYFLFKDKNNDPLEFWCTGDSKINVTIFQSNGTVILKPEQDWSGEEKIRFFASDNIVQETVNFDVTVLVEPVNDPPGPVEIISPNDDIEITYGTPLDFVANCTDPDIPYGDKLIYYWTSNISGDLGTGRTLKEILLENRVHKITVTVTDSWGISSTNSVQVFVLKMDPTKDNDGDGIPNSWELENGLNISDSTDAGKDNDGDGLSNLEEYEKNTDPQNPDTDGDKHNDKEDAYPLDETKWEKEDEKPPEKKQPDEKKSDDSFWLGISAAIIIFVIVIILLFFLLIKRKKKGDEEAQKTLPGDKTVKQIQQQVTPPIKQHEQRSCSTCGISLKYYSQNDKYYCHNCKKYE